VTADEDIPATFTKDKFEDGFNVVLGLAIYPISSSVRRESTIRISTRASASLQRSKLINALQSGSPARRQAVI
jgi:hypothetical protein